MDIQLLQARINYSYDKLILRRWHLMGLTDFIIRVLRDQEI